MKISDLYPSKFIKADDLMGQRHRLTIMSVTVEEISDSERKPVLRFMRKEKGLVLNKTNATHLAQAFGDDTIQWQGMLVELVAMPTTFNGKPVQGIVCMPVLEVPDAATPTAAPADPFAAYQQQDAQQRGQFQQPGPATVKGPVEQELDALAEKIDAAEQAPAADGFEEIPF